MPTKIPAKIDLKLLSANGDAAHTFSLFICIAGFIDAVFNCELTTVEFFQNPVLTKLHCDSFGLPPELADRFAVIMGQRMLRVLDSESGAQRVVAIEPNLQDVINTAFYHHDASQLNRLLSRKLASRLPTYISKPRLTIMVNDVFTLWGNNGE
jgi:hypothetical protein